MSFTFLLNKIDDYLCSIRANVIAEDRALTLKQIAELEDLIHEELEKIYQEQLSR